MTDPAVLRARFNRRLRTRLATTLRDFDARERGAVLLRLDVHPAIGITVFPIERTSSSSVSAGYALRIGVCWGDAAVIADWCGAAPLTVLDLDAYERSVDGAVPGDSPAGFAVTPRDLADPERLIVRAVGRVVETVRGIDDGTVASIADLGGLSRVQG